MGLIDLQTDLKSLKYSTVPGNGTGPIIRKSIPEEQTSTIGYSIQNPFKGPGFFQAIDEDVKRVEGWFDQNRGSWAIKQSTLELFNPKTEVPLINRIPDVLGINAVVNTAGSPLGIHLHKNGIAGFISDRDKYETTARDNNNLEDPKNSKNRLVELTNRFIYQNTSQTLSFLGPLSGFANNVSEFFNPDDSVLFSYVGGPGGPITTIRKPQNPNGTFGLPNFRRDNSYFIGDNQEEDNENTYIKSLGFENYTFENIQGSTLGSILAKYTGSDGSKFSNPTANLDTTIQTDPYELGLDEVTNTYSEENSYYEDERDFSLDRIGAPSRKDVFGKIMAIKTSNDNTPRIRANYNDQSSNSNVDPINTLPIEKKYSEEYGVRDLIKFRFGVIDNTSPSNITSLQFRAYLTNFNDNFNPSWDSVKYIGRGEEFYNYTGFSRNISFALAFAATTKEELLPLYNKINYLASLTAPDYTDNGYIRGNIVKLTIGDYIGNQPGVIDSLSYNIEDNVMWEINLEGRDDLRQYPHVLRAQIGMKLIHSDLPKINSRFIGNNKPEPFRIQEKTTEMALRDVRPIENTLPQSSIVGGRPAPPTRRSPVPTLPTFDTNAPLGSEGSPFSSLLNIP